MIYPRIFLLIISSCLLTYSQTLSFFDEFTADTSTDYTFYSNSGSGTGSFTISSEVLTVISSGQNNDNGGISRSVGDIRSGLFRYEVDIASITGDLGTEGLFIGLSNDAAFSATGTFGIRISPDLTTGEVIGATESLAFDLGEHFASSISNNGLRIQFFIDTTQTTQIFRVNFSMAGGGGLTISGILSNTFDEEVFIHNNAQSVASPSVSIAYNSLRFLDESAFLGLEFAVPTGLTGNLVGTNLVDNGDDTGASIDLAENSGIGSLAQAISSPARNLFDEGFGAYSLDADSIAAGFSISEGGFISVPNLDFENLPSQFSGNQITLTVTVAEAFFISINNPIEYQENLVVNVVDISPPTFTALTATVMENDPAGTVDIDLLQGVTGSGSLTISDVSFSIDGGVTYSPNLPFFTVTGTDLEVNANGFDNLAAGETYDVAIRYFISNDGELNATARTGTVSVVGVNDPPVFSGLSNLHFFTGVASSIDLADFFPDIDGDVLSISITEPLPNGLSLSNGVISGTASTLGNTALTVMVDDGNGGTLSESVNLSVVTLAGDITGSITANSVATISSVNDLVLTDVDGSSYTFGDVAFTFNSAAGSYGSLRYATATGLWTYDVDHNNATVLGLSAGDSLQDRVTIRANNATNTEVDITVTITGVNDAPRSTGVQIQNSPSDFSNILNSEKFLSTAIRHISFTDFDNDGDEDLVLVDSEIDESRVSYYINNSNGTFTRATDSANPFSFYTNNDYRSASFVFGDLDNDGDEDFLVSGVDLGFTRYRNNGNGTFSISSSRFLGSYVSLRAALMDVDSDGDLDAVLGTGNLAGVEGAPTLIYARNDGSGNFSEVTDSAANPFSHISSNNFEVPVFVDWDGDGDEDLVVTREGGTLDYYRNEGLDADTNLPIFTQVTGFANPFFHIDLDVITSIPNFSDIDNDGDLDLIISLATFSRNPVYYRNNRNFAINVDSNITQDLLVGISDPEGATVNVVASSITYSIDEGSPSSALPTGFTYANNQITVDYSAYASLSEGETVSVVVSFNYTDGSLTNSRDFVFHIDGVNDAPVAQTATYTSTENSISSNQLPTPMDVDGDTEFTYTLVDIPTLGSVVLDADGMYTFDPENAFGLLGEGETTDVTFTYTVTDEGGAVSEPATITLRILGLNSVPFIPSRVGVLEQLTGSANIINAVTSDTTGNSFANSSYGGNFADYDSDGDLDFFLSNANGEVFISVNTNGSYAEAVALVDGDGNAIDTLGALTVTLADADGDGDDDLLLGGTRFDRSHYYRNDGGTFNEQTGVNNPLNNISLAEPVGSRIDYTFADLDNDLDLDLLITNGSSETAYYRNDGGSYIRVADADNPFSEIFSFSFQLNIQFVDVTGDGNLDLLVLDGPGRNIEYYRNDGYDGDGKLIFTEVTNPANNPFSDITFDETGNLLTTGDYDGDGDVDFIVFQSQLSEILLYRNNSEFSDSFSSGTLTRSLIEGAIDSDGDELNVELSSVRYSINDGTESSDVPAGFSLADNVLTVDSSAYASQTTGDETKVTVSYRITDGALTLDRTYVVTIVGENGLPVYSGALVYNFVVGSSSSVDFTSLFSDPDSDSLSYSYSLSSTLPAGLSLNQTTGVLSGSANAFGTSVLTIEVADSAGTISQDVTIYVVSLVGDYSGSVAADESGTISNATALSLIDANGSSGYTLDSGSGTYGTLTYNPTTGIWTYDVNQSNSDLIALNATESVEDTFTFTGANSAGTQSTVTITINGVNNAPTFSGGFTESLMENDASSPVSINLLAGVTDVDTSDSLSTDTIMYSVDGGTNYTPTLSGFSVSSNVLSVNADNFDDLTASDTLTVMVRYNVSDGTADVERTGTVTITGVNDAPRISGDVTATVTQNLSSFTLDLLSGATDIDSSSLSITTPTITVNGNPVSSLPAGFSRTDEILSVDPMMYTSLDDGESFNLILNYAVTDSTAETAQRAVVSIDGINDAPVFVGSETTHLLFVNSATNLDLNLLFSDIDTSDSLEYSLSAGTLPSGLSLSGGVITGTATSVEDVNITVRVTDGDEVINQAFILSITSIQVGGDLLATISADRSTNISNTNGLTLLSPSGDGSFSLSNGNGTYGNLTYVAATGIWTYNLNESHSALLPLGAGETLTDSFTLIGDDADSTEVTVQITITGVNENPVIPGAPLTQSVQENQSTTDVVIDLLQGVTDSDANDTLMIMDVEYSLTGNAADFASMLEGFSTSGNNLLVDSTIFDELDAGDSLPVHIRYNISDDTVELPRTAIITIMGVNDAPEVAAALSLTLDESDTSMTLDLLSGATDADDASALSITSLEISVDGSTVGALPSGFSLPTSSSMLSIDPSVYNSLADGESLVLVLSYDVNDNTATAAQTATVTINGEDDIPMFLGGSNILILPISTNSDIDLSTFFTDADASDDLVYTLSASSTALPNGLTLNADGTITGLSVLVADTTITVEVTDGTTVLTEDFVIRVTQVQIMGSLTGTVAADSSSNINNVGEGLVLSDLNGVSTFTLPSGTGAGDYGTLTYNSTSGVWTYNLNENLGAVIALADGETLADSFTLQGNDIFSTEATVVITITGVNDLPVATTLTAGLTENESTSNISIDLLAGVTDADTTDVLSITSIEYSINGGTDYTSTLDNFSLSGNSLNLLVDSNGFEGLSASDSLVVNIRYVISDGTGTTMNTGVVTVTGANDAPEFTGSSRIVNLFVGETLDYDLSSLFTDVDGDDLSYTIDETLPTGLMLSDSSLVGTIASIIPSMNITLNVSDGNGGNISETLTLSFISVGGDLSASITADESGTISNANALTLEDSDGTEMFTRVGDGTGTYGSLAYDADTGIWTYDLNESSNAVLALAEGQAVTDSFTLVGTNSVATPVEVVITITGVNEAPAGAPLAITLTENGATNTINLLEGVTDVDTDLSTLAINTIEFSFNGAPFSASLPANIGVTANTIMVDTNAFDSLGAGDNYDLSFRYNVSDEIDELARTGTLRITGVNDLASYRTLGEDSLNILAGSAVSIDLNDYFTDIDGTSLSYTTSGLPSGLNLASSTGIISGTTSAIGSHTLDIVINDGDDPVTLEFTLQVINVTIEGVYTATVAADSSTTIGNAGGTALTFNSDQMFTLVGDGTGTYGTFTLSGAGIWTYDVDEDTNALIALGEGDTVTDTFTLMGSGSTPIEQSFVITITGVNNLPEINSVLDVDLTDGFSASEGMINLLAGVTDVDSDDLSVTGVTYSTDGSSFSADAVAGFSINENTLVILPSSFENLNIGDTYTLHVRYNIEDGTGSVTRDVEVNITGVNNPPTIGSSIVASVNQNVSSFTLDLLSGATDVDNDNDSLTFSTPVIEVDGISQGTLPDGFTLAVDGTLTIEPSEYAHLDQGDDIELELSYNVNDANGGSTAQTLTVTISGLNDAPTFTGSSNVLQFFVNGTVSYDLSNFFTDIDEDDLMYSVSSGTLPTGLTLTNGVLGGTPTSASDGNITIQVTDGTDPIMQVFNIVVTNVVFTGNLSASIAADSTDVLSNDGVGEALTLEDSGQAGDEIFEYTGDGNGNYGVFTYDSGTGIWTYDVDETHSDLIALADVETLVDSFTLTGTDSSSTDVTVTVTITGVNDIPVSEGDFVRELTEDLDNPTTSFDLSSGVDDIDGDDLVVSNVLYSIDGATPVADVPTGFTLVDNVLTVDVSNYEHLGAGETFDVALSYDISDGTETIARQGMIRITGINSAPTFTGSLTLDVTQNDDPDTLDLLEMVTDVDNENLSISLLTLTLDGEDITDLPEGFTLETTTLNVDPSVYANLDVGEEVELVVTYNISDGDDVVERTATITIAGANDAPTLRSGASTRVTVSSMRESSVDLADLFIDLDGDELQYTSSSALPTGLVLSIAGVLSGTTTVEEGEFPIIVSVFDGTVGLSPTLQELTLVVLSNPISALLDQVEDEEVSLSSGLSDVLVSLENDIDRVEADSSLEGNNIASLRDVLQELFTTTASTTESQIAILESLRPRNNTVVSSGVDQVINDVNQSIQQQVISSLPTGLVSVSGPEDSSAQVSSKSKFYYSFSYTAGARDGESGAVGYGHSGFNLGIGYDRNFSGIYLGAGLSYIGSSIDSNNNAGEVDISTVSLSLYGSYELDSSFATASLTLGISSVDSTRTTGVSSLSGDTSVFSLDLSALYGYVFKYHHYKITALGGLRYSNSSLDDLEEEGLGSVISKGQSYSSFYLRGGGIISQRILQQGSDDFQHRISFSGMLSLNLLEVERNSDDRFNDGVDVFKTQGVDDARANLTLSFGWHIKHYDKMNYEFSYDININSISSSGSLNAKVKHIF